MTTGSSVRVSAGKNSSFSDPINVASNPKVVKSEKQKEEPINSVNVVKAAGLISDVKATLARLRRRLAWGAAGLPPASCASTRC